MTNSIRTIFNAFEVFEIAERIERNGARFYRKAAVCTSDSDLSALLLELSAMEQEHEKTFVDIRKNLLSQERQLTLFDPVSEIAKYLSAIADGYVFDLQKDLSEVLKDRHSETDILKMAIGLEKDSIVFYLGIKDLVPESSGKKRIDEIIREEMGHIRQLSEKLKNLT